MPADARQHRSYDPMILDRMHFNAAISSEDTPTKRFPAEHVAVSSAQSVADFLHKAARSPFRAPEPLRALDPPGLWPPRHL